MLLSVDEGYAHVSIALCCRAGWISIWTVNSNRRPIAKVWNMRTWFPENIRRIQTSSTTITSFKVSRWVQLLLSFLGNLFWLLTNWSNFFTNNSCYFEFPSPEFASKEIFLDIKKLVVFGFINSQTFGNSNNCVKGDSPEILHVGMQSLRWNFLYQCPVGKSEDHGNSEDIQLYSDP